MLTPQDIANKEFKKALYGYNAKEVDGFLQEICDSYEKLYKENLAAKERISMLADAVKQYKSMEETLQNALTVAERSGEDVKKNAYDKAEVIIKDAENQAAEIINQSAMEVAKVTYSYEQMKRSVEVFRAKVVALLNAQLDIIKDYSNIEIDDQTVKEAKALYEKGMPLAGRRIDKQDTEEIPQITHDENGGYKSADE